MSKREIALRNHSGKYVPVHKALAK